MLWLASAASPPWKTRSTCPTLVQCWARCCEWATSCHWECPGCPPMTPPWLASTCPRYAQDTALPSPCQRGVSTAPIPNLTWRHQPAASCNISHLWSSPGRCCRAVWISPLYGREQWDSILLVITFIFFFKAYLSGFTEDDLHEFWKQRSKKHRKANSLDLLIPQSIREHLLK